MILTCSNTSYVFTSMLKSLLVQTGSNAIIAFCFKINVSESLHKVLMDFNIVFEWGFDILEIDS